MNALQQGAIALVFGMAAAGFAPDPIVTVSAWAEESRQVAPEASPRPGKWRNADVPHLVEVMDVLSFSDPSREVVFKKAAQLGATESGINFIGTVACRTPAPLLVVLPTDGEVQKYVNLKLNPAISATAEMRSRIYEQKSRDEKGSTTRLKKFPGGFLSITGANSSSGLQMISVRGLILEEVSEYPFDVDGKGDPMKLAIDRTKAYSKIRKIFYNSTPDLKGSCRVSAKYEESDQRQRYVACPHCDTFHVLKFENLRWRSETRPHGAHFICPACGDIIEARHKDAMLAPPNAVWLKTYPGEDTPGDLVLRDEIQLDERGHHARPSRGREPGFAAWTAYSPFEDWDEVVHEWLDARGDPLKERTFWRNWLGEAWEAKGDAPDYLKLFGRREPFAPRHVPHGCLFLTGAADVQGNRLEWAVWGWGIGKTRWLIDKGIIEGDTSELATFRPLDEVLQRQYPNHLGRLFGVEAFAIDTGHNTQAVYAWVRRHASSGRVLGIKGMPGHLHPPLGTPSKVDVSYRGERLKGGVMLWPVGTWMLKAEFYAQLRKTIEGPDENGVRPPGYVYLPMDGVDEAYLKQLTAEFLVTREKGGRSVQEWHKAKDQPNEALDIAVYAAAAAAHLGIDQLTPAQWQKLAAERGAPPEKIQQELALWQGLVPAAAATTPAAPAHAVRAEVASTAASTAQQAPAKPSWLGERKGKWI